MILLLSSASLFQLAAQPAKIDQRPLQEVKAKAKAGDAESQVQLGLRYDQGEGGVAKDLVEAAKWFRKSAEQNYAKAQYNLGVCYDNGQAVAKDQAEAAKWYRKAAEQNMAEGSIQSRILLLSWRRRGRGLCGGRQVAAAGGEARQRRGQEKYHQAAKRDDARANCGGTKTGARL